MGKLVNIPDLLKKLNGELNKLREENAQLVKEKKLADSRLVVANSTTEVLRQEAQAKEVEAEDPTEPVSEETKKPVEEVPSPESKAPDLYSRSYLLVLAILLLVVFAVGFILGYSIGSYSPSEENSVLLQVEAQHQESDVKQAKKTLTPILPKDDIDIYYQDAGVSLWRLTPPVQPIVPPDILWPVKEEKIVSQPGPKIDAKQEVAPKALPLVKSRFPQDKRVGFRKVLVGSPKVAKKKSLPPKKIQSKPKTTAPPAAPVILSAPVTCPGFKLKFVGRWWKEPFETVE